MMAAMDAIKVFDKKQKKFEQRERPIDVLNQKRDATTFAALETTSSVVIQSTTATPLRKRVVGNNRGHAYFYFPHRKSTGVA